MHAERWTRKARFPFKRKRLRWQAANHGCHCFDRAFLLAGACVCLLREIFTQQTQAPAWPHIFWLIYSVATHCTISQQIVTYQVNLCSHHLHRDIYGVVLSKLGSQAHSAEICQKAKGEIHAHRRLSTYAHGFYWKGMWRRRQRI